MNERFGKAVKDLYPDRYNTKVREWLNERYGEQKAETIWAATEENYLCYLEDMRYRWKEE